MLNAVINGSLVFILTCMQSMCGSSASVNIVVNQSLRDEAFWSLSGLADRSDYIIVGSLVHVVAMPPVAVEFEPGDLFQAAEMLLTLGQSISIPMRQGLPARQERVSVRCIVANREARMMKYPSQVVPMTGQNLLLFVKVSKDNTYSCSQPIFNSIWRIEPYLHADLESVMVENRMLAAAYLIGDPLVLAKQTNRIRSMDESLGRGEQLVRADDAMTLLEYYLKHTSGHDKAAACFAILSRTSGRDRSCLAAVCAQATITGQDRFRCGLISKAQ